MTEEFMDTRRHQGPPRGPHPRENMGNNTKLSMERPGMHVTGPQITGRSVALPSPRMGGRPQKWVEVDRRWVF